MKTLKGNTVYLRALEPTDLNFLYKLENEESLWEVSGTLVPFSKYVLSNYIKNSHKDIFEVKQLRLIIALIENENAIGAIDFFNYEPKHKKVEVGIVIQSNKYKKKGYAFEALQLLSNYAFKHLNLHQIYASVIEDNIASISLFEKAKFIKTGIKKDWILSNGIYKNVIQYQLINE